MNDKKPFQFKRKLRQAGLFLASALLLPLLLTLIPALADEPEFVTIASQEVINDDLYLAADTITIDGTVKGDAVLAASRITLNGTIEGDLIAAGQIITVNGIVRDDVRMAGQVLVLGESARVNDDVIAAGYSLENQKGSAITGNLNYFGGQGLFAGTVQQNIRGAAAAMQIAGKVNGNVKVTVGTHNLSRPPFIPEAPSIPQIPAGLTLTDTAQISGNLTYRAAADAAIATGATVSGRVVREEIPTVDTQPANVAFTILFQVQRLIALALVGWLLLRFVPGWTQTLAATVKAKPLPSLGWGILTVGLVMAAAIALSIVTVLVLIISGLLLPSLALPVLGIGFLTLFALLIGFGTVVSFVPPIVLSFWGGKWLMTKLRPDRAISNLVALVAGLAGFVILTAIPVMGWIVNVIVIFLGLGALWLWWRKSHQSNTDSQILLTTI
jgi:cytoskeletal protein CcmA (bactofilin family)